MTEFKEQWDLEMALQVLQNKTVDGQVWSEAVKWLLLYGPPQIKEILQQASSTAFNDSFPGVVAKGYNEEGHPYYDINDLAEAMGVSAEEVAGGLAEIQFDEGVEVFVEGDRVYKVQ